ncbi:ThiF family adenylyltransferase [Lactobacillus sp. DCY120]|uniref:ThiF family adenylyltransferase n=1 Tax=Bombilactobacillus apium TaxID=2675299 RepID=A0A850R3I4_9LACO|nr:ThiF family adenylyltransferase [Bombilactobacillus apium]NVY96531.1 ThiF family adenylyltransferase [Bombilactobacillus apium]
MAKLLDYYPMIHRDKLVYTYQTGIVRIGTDDNDVIEITDPEGKFLPICQLMDGEHSVRSLLQEFPELSLRQLSLMIVKLGQKHSLAVLEEPFSEMTQAGRFQADLTYYYSEGFAGDQVLEQIQKMHVTIFGAGGGGSLLALQLINLGVQHLHLVDDDLIEQSNLNRQFLFQDQDLGHFKVDAVRQFLLARQPQAQITVSKQRITSVAGAKKELENADWGFCCIDEPPYIAQRIINRACFEKQIPSLYGFSARDSGKLLLVDPRKTACIDCLLSSRDNAGFQQLITAFQNGDFHPTTPIILPNMLLETAWIAKRWLDQVLQRQEFGNALYRFDYNQLQEEKFVPFTRQDNCPTCGSIRNRSKLWSIIPIQ